VVDDVNCDDNCCEDAFHNLDDLQYLTQPGEGLKLQRFKDDFFTNNSLLTIAGVLMLADH
jgi:hypothetical protein